MSSDVAVSAQGAGKAYLVYEKPEDRLKQAVLGRLARAMGRPVPRYFREFWALRDVSFDLLRGETVGIIGRNGAGKSTLLQMICGTLTPTTGSVRTSGRVAALLELGSGFNPEFSGRENVKLNASILGLSDAEIADRLDDIVAFADLGDFIDQPVKTYSSGMTVRLAFAVVAHVDADILIIDEALAVGDAFFVQKCMRFLRDFTKRGTLIFVSHDTSAVLALCDRAIWLDGGRLIQDDSPKSVADNYLARLHGGEEAPLLQAEPTRSGGAPSAVRLEEAIHTLSETRPRLFPDSTSFGAGGAEILNVALLDLDGRPLAGVAGGEDVALVVVAAARADLSSPILGFYVRDRLGQNLFGENSYLTYAMEPLSVAAGEQFRARFDFTMPYLPPGDYSICVATADGTQMKHVHHQWINDALIFKSHSRDGYRGLVGLTRMKIELGRSPGSRAG
jgi:lipopolysaccharide transport system ATP-binding protein